MRLVASRWIVLVIFLLIIQISANSPEYKVVFQNGEFLMESIHQVLAIDPDHNQQPELVITGKNYTAQEVFIYGITVPSDFKPVVKWQSTNLFEALSTLWVCTGKFTSDQTQVLALTNQNLYFYQSDKDGLVLAKQQTHNFTKILCVTSGDFNGDGRDELVIAKVGKITHNYYNGVCQVWQLNNDKPVLVAESDLLGNIRSITAGDLDGDGKSELIIEEGLRFEPGNVHVLSLKDNKLVERFCLKKAVDGAIYSMTVADYKGEPRLVTASSSGKINFFNWKNNALSATGSQIAFDNDELVSVTALQTSKDRIPELIVVGYPQKFIILSPNEGIN